MDADLSAAVAKLTTGLEREDGWGTVVVDATAVRAILAALAEAQEADAAIVRAFVERVCARAEADVLGGSPLEGAHYRAMQEELRRLEQHADGEAQP